MAEKLPGNVGGGSSAGTSDARKANMREQRRLTLILVGSVIALDLAVIGIYYALHIPERMIKTQETFIAVWVVLTLLVVATLMRKIRRLRPPRRR